MAVNHRVDAPPCIAKPHLCPGPDKVIACTCQSHLMMLETVHVGFLGRHRVRRWRCVDCGWTKPYETEDGAP